MKHRTTLRIPQRRRIFLGCEGESEQSYGALLSRLLDERHRRIHIDTVLLPPGSGAPLALVERSIRRIREQAARGSPYAGTALLLDDDTRRQSAVRDERAVSLARQAHLLLVWQAPCHEALLLRHLPGCEALRPPTTDRAMVELRRVWPDDRKGTPAMRLAERIGERDVLRAAASDGGLQAFLAMIEFATD